jgi:hypothetical protein
MDEILGTADYVAGAGARPGAEIFTDRIAGAPYGPLYSVAPDGERLLVLSRPEEDRQTWAIQVHLGWLERLREQLTP